MAESVMETGLPAGGQKSGGAGGAGPSWAPPGGVPPGPLARAPGGRRQEPDMHHGPAAGIRRVSAPTSHVCRSVNVEDLRKFDHERYGKTGTT
jgi:hypothetical protein